MTRLDDLRRLYDILAELEQRLGGRRRLSNCTKRAAWPRRGVYFFFEDGEERSDTGHGPRLVRVGTHALTSSSKASLWGRLSQHRGAVSTGGGNHRGSIFRLLVGASLIRRDSVQCASWGVCNSLTDAAKRLDQPRENVVASELPVERAVSEHIRAMPFVWVDVDDPPGPRSLRGYIERNTIALLSNYDRTVIDPPSRTWLGRYCDRERVRSSGLWNNRHVDEVHEPAFLDQLERACRQTHAP
ncbi:MAG: hypothetical protein D6689_19835 [Deltaproteobacteria bacterium]|nr:MAG: hypothetical protein D6689_19835 [Deltaproteobacteria bacterium]